jgi:coenzyme F420 hydrogenase subunit beta
MEASPLGHSQHKDSICLVIGIFCTWALDYRLVHKFFKDKGLQGLAKRYDIPPPPANVFRVITESKTFGFPLELIRPMILPGCSFCCDMTAETADLSVGAVEGMDDWNTLIVRTQKGEDLVRAARQRGVLEIEDLPEENLSHLEEASVAKRKRALA